MRKLIVATVALAFLATPALAQDKSGTSTTPAAKSSDTMSKGEMGKMSKKKSKKSSKSMKKSADDTMKKQ